LFTNNKKTMFSPDKNEAATSENYSPNYREIREKVLNGGKAEDIPDLDYKLKTRGLLELEDLNRLINENTERELAERIQEAVRFARS
jgi:hypothetical protein